MLRFSKSPTVDLALSLGLFVVVSISLYLLLSMDIDGVDPILESETQHTESTKKKRDSTLRSPSASMSHQHQESHSRPRLIQQPNPPSKNRAEPQEAESPSFSQLKSMIDRGDWLDAEAILLKKLEKDPLNLEFLLELAMIQIIDKKEPEAAKPYLKTALSVNPENESIVSELVTLYEEGDNLAEGVDFFKGLVSGGEVSGPLSFGIGTSLLSMGRSEEAIEYLERASDLGGVQMSLVLDDLTDAYLDAGRIAEAADLFADLIQEGASHDEMKSFTMRLAHAHIEQGDQDQAEKILSDWLKRNPDDDFARKVLKDVQN